jgi:hypothetical protein
VRTPIFSIGIYTGPSALELSPAPDASNPVLTAADVTDGRAGYVADPFMIRVRGTWYMYFEVLNLTSGRGEIALAISNDGMTWEYKQIVLREPFHLSYPYVFEWQGEYYMVPESYQAQSVRLYRAVDFPLVWSHVVDLITGDAFEDSSLFRFDDRWWMLNDLSRVPYYAGTLRLFCAERLTGPWTEHPMSPIIDGDPHIARPAGRVLVCDDRVIRFTQDCCPVYGIQVRAFELTGLTTTALEQRDLMPTPMLQGSGEGWNAAGMHHVDVHRRPDRGGWIACVDGWYWKIEGDDPLGQAPNR